MVDLFSSYKIKNVSFKNRIVMPPMVIGWSDNSGSIYDDHIEYYKKRAKGGCGLIILEAHSITKDGSPSIIAARYAKEDSNLM